MECGYAVEYLLSHGMLTGILEKLQKMLITHGRREQMDKSQLISFYGSNAQAAKAIGISTAGMSIMKDKLSQKSIDRIIGYLHRNGKEIPEFLINKP